MPAHMTVKGAPKKPAKGSAAKAKRARRRKVDLAEQIAKTSAKVKSYFERKHGTTAAV